MILRIRKATVTILTYTYTLWYFLGFHWASGIRGNVFGIETCPQRWRSHPTFSAMGPWRRRLQTPREIREVVLDNCSCFLFSKMFLFQMSVYLQESSDLESFFLLKILSASYRCGTYKCSGANSTWSYIYREIKLTCIYTVTRFAFKCLCKCKVRSLLISMRVCCLKSYMLVLETNSIELRKSCRNMHTK